MPSVKPQEMSGESMHQLHYETCSDQSVRFSTPKEYIEFAIRATPLQPGIFDAMVDVVYGWYTNLAERGGHLVGYDFLRKISRAYVKSMDIHYEWKWQLTRTSGRERVTNHESQ